MLDSRRCAKAMGYTLAGAVGVCGDRAELVSARVLDDLATGRHTARRRELHGAAELGDGAQPVGQRALKFGGRLGDLHLDRHRVGRTLPAHHQSASLRAGITRNDPGHLLGTHELFFPPRALFSSMRPELFHGSGHHNYTLLCCQRDSFDCPGSSRKIHGPAGIF